MFTCSKCQTSNDDDATFCTHCGMPLRSEVKSTFDQQTKQFAQTMEQMGKKIGDQMAQVAKQVHKTTQTQAKQFEQRMDRMSYRAESWYNRTFGIFGPLLESFIFLIVFRVIIMVMELPNQSTPEIHTLATILLVYILPFFVLSLLSNYTQYFAKKYYKFKIFSPLLYAIFFVLFCWILSRILYDVSIQFPTPNLQTAALSLENNLPSIFIFILLLGYVILILSLPRDQMNKP